MSTNTTLIHFPWACCMPDDLPKGIVFNAYRPGELAECIIVDRVVFERVELVTRKWWVADRTGPGVEVRLQVSGQTSRSWTWDANGKLTNW